jgi:hypothetical protein
MPILQNIYCDESCHLERDHQPAMVLGALWCASDKVAAVARRVREIKANHGLPPGFEAKWTKVSPAKLPFYQSLIDYFFDDDDLHFRALIAPKASLRHEDFGQDHDTWYYKMYFELLKFILSPDGRYRVYLDIKDTRSADKVRTLHEVLANNLYDFDWRIVERVQTVRSHEVAPLQLVDLLVGSVVHANRPGGTSAAKRALVERVRERSGYALSRSTLLGERKLNLFHWKPLEA